MDNAMKEICCQALLSIRLSKELRDDEQLEVTKDCMEEEAPPCILIVCACWRQKTNPRSPKG